MATITACWSHWPEDFHPWIVGPSPMRSTPMVSQGLLCPSRQCSATLLASMWPPMLITTLTLWVNLFHCKRRWLLLSPSAHILAQKKSRKQLKCEIKWFCLLLSMIDKEFVGNINNKPKSHGTILVDILQRVRNWLDCRGLLYQRFSRIASDTFCFFKWRLLGFGFFQF